ncbi:MAG TPA: YciI family protein, partial [Sphingobacteriaceae bacterium]
MKQYLIYAYDFTDSEALSRRLKVRPEHFEKARQMKAAGTFVIGGAILNDAGQMIGSTMVLQFEDEDGLNNWKGSEPYILGRVWEKIEIRPFKV